MDASFMAESQASRQQMFFWFSRRVLRRLGRVRTISAKSNDMSCSRISHADGQRSQRDRPVDEVQFPATHLPPFQDSFPRGAIA
jgi:hypothetical protein